MDEGFGSGTAAAAAAAAGDDDDDDEGDGRRTDVSAAEKQGTGEGLVFGSIAGQDQVQR